MLTKHCVLPRKACSQNGHGMCANPAHSSYIFFGLRPTVFHIWRRPDALFPPIISGATYAPNGMIEYISLLVERLYFCAEDMPRCVGIAGQSSQIIHHLFDQDEFNTDSITSH
jgi:hypothetical protein